MGVYPTRNLGQWIQSRVADADHEATFAVEVDERYIRIRRIHGGSASMVEHPLTVGAPATAQEVVTAVTRWATSSGLIARTHTQFGPHAVTLQQRTD